MDIAEEIIQIKDEICAECTKSNLQLSQIEIPQDLILAPLTFYCGSFGLCQESSLHSIACAVEMLNLAVKYHYEQKHEDKGVISNLNLITGDFLYARGIVYVSRLCNGFYVSCMTQSINDIVRAESKPKSFNEVDSIIHYLELRASLFKTAAYLGGLAASLSDEEVKTMSKVGKLFGMGYYLNSIFELELVEEPLYSEVNLQLKNDLNKKIGSLPKIETRDFLNDFIRERIYGN